MKRLNIFPLRPISFSAVIPPENLPKCQQPLYQGPCGEYLIRYYFNQNTQECRDFVYGGCLGYDNNFETLEQCKTECDNGTREANGKYKHAFFIILNGAKTENDKSHESNNFTSFQITLGTFCLD